MAVKKGRRRFGNVRKLPSGRFQARYVGPDGVTRTAQGTFGTERLATKWLTVTESEIIRGDWQAPEGGEVELGEYGVRWIAERTLAPRTREAYEDLFRLYVSPHLGSMTLDSIKPQVIRRWRSRLLDEGKAEPQAVKAYSLLRAILNTAVNEDGAIRQNPCRIKGYDRYHTPERPVANVDQVLALADVVPDRYRALVLTAALTGLRWGELAALRRSDVDLSAGVVRVPRKLAALRNGMAFGPPKSEAGVRAVALPASLVEELRTHLARFAGGGAEALVFTGGKGALLRTGNFRRAVDWPEVTAKAGLPAGFHFHDLRHTGNQLAAAAGASTRELMHRMGHASMRAALIYQHATSERDRQIAAGIDGQVRRHAGPTEPQVA
jgi:integrase